MLPDKGKKLGIMQPYFFPYLGYFQLLHAVDTLVFYDDVNFIKNGWINRNRLLLNDDATYFTVPLSNASSFAKINQVKLSSHRGWRRKLIETFHHAYSRAPHYAEVEGIFAGVLAANTGCIGELAKRSVMSVSQYLSLRCQFVETSAIYGNSALNGEERVIDICLREHASTYINLSGGRSLYDAERFAEKKIQLAFIDAKAASYRQFSITQVPNLSILDVLMFNPKDTVVEMMGSYDLDFPHAKNSIL